MNLIPKTLALKVANYLARISYGADDDRNYFPGGSFYGGIASTSKSGALVTEQTAMSLAVVWCCIKILSEDSASLPLHLYKRLPNGGKEKATKHPKYRLLHDMPNPEMTAMTFRECYGSHLVGWGNAYAEKEYGKGRIGSSNVENLWLITPDRIKPIRDKETKQIVYDIRLPENTQTVILPKRLVMHTPALGFNGLMGYSPIAMARETIGLNMALEEFGEKFFSNGSNAGGFLEYPGHLEPKAYENMRKSIDAQNTGLSKAHRLMILMEGMKFNKNTIPPNDAQFLESRKFQNIEIGTKIYRLPAHMYGEMDASTNNNIEHQGIEYVTGALRPWLVRLEQSYNMNLLEDYEREEYFFEHAIEGLLRGDLKSRYDAYAIGRINKWLSADEIREFENMNPLPNNEGKKYENPNITVQDKKEITKPNTENDEKVDEEKIKKAYSGLFVSTMQRIVSRETLAISKAIKTKLNKGDINEFNNWLDEFYNESPEHIKNQVLPLFTSFVAMLSDKNIAEDLVSEFVKNHISESKTIILSNIENIDNLMVNWSTNKADILANTEMENILRRLKNEVV